MTGERGVRQVKQTTPCSFYPRLLHKRGSGRRATRWLRNAPPESPAHSLIVERGIVHPWFKCPSPHVDFYPAPSSPHLSVPAADELESITEQSSIAPKTTPPVASNLGDIHAFGDEELCALCCGSVRRLLCACVRGLLFFLLGSRIQQVCM